MWASMYHCPATEIGSGWMLGRKASPTSTCSLEEPGVGCVAWAQPIRHSLLGLYSWNSVTSIKKEFERLFMAVGGVAALRVVSPAMFWPDSFWRELLCFLLPAHLLSGPLPFANLPFQPPIDPEPLTSFQLTLLVEGGHSSFISPVVRNPSGCLCLFFLFFTFLL